MSGIGMFLLGSGSSLINISDKSVDDSHDVVSPSTASAQAGYQLGSDGVARFNRQSDGNGSYSGEWLVGGLSSDYEAMFTIVSGSPTGVTFNSWLSLSSSRTVSVSATQSVFGSTTNTATVTVQIRTTSGLLLDSATITLSATATVDA